MQKWLWGGLQLRVRWYLVNYLKTGGVDSQELIKNAFLQNQRQFLTRLDSFLPTIQKEFRDWLTMPASDSDLAQLSDGIQPKGPSLNLDTIKELSGGLLFFQKFQLLGGLMGMSSEDLDSPHIEALVFRQLERAIFDRTVDQSQSFIDLATQLGI